MGQVHPGAAIGADEHVAKSEDGRVPSGPGAPASGLGGEPVGAWNPDCRSDPVLFPSVEFESAAVDCGYFYFRLDWIRGIGGDGLGALPLDQGVRQDRAEGLMPAET